MMTATNWQDEFPMHEEFEDFSGRRRPFVITCHEGGLGFTVRASEEETSNWATSSRHTVRRVLTAL